MNPLYIYFSIFFCIGYLIVTDSFVAQLFVFLTEIVKIQYQKIKWIILHSPNNPLVRFMVHRRSLRLAKELMCELAKKEKKI